MKGSFLLDPTEQDFCFSHPIMKERFAMNSGAPTLSASVSSLSFQGRDVPLTQQLKAYADRRLSSSLGRFGNRVQDIALWFDDINGPRGGNDKRCRVQVRLKRKGQFVVSAVAANEYLALSHAADRSRTLMDRTLKQLRTKRRGAGIASITHLPTQTYQVSTAPPARVSAEPLMMAEPATGMDCSCWTPRTYRE